jgi:hypothetical protein
MFEFELFGKSDEQQIADMVGTFPAVLDQAVRDYAKFKVAVKSGTVSQTEHQEIAEWFYQFPRLWETIKPNFEPRTQSGVYSSRRANFYEKADNFSKRISGDQKSASGLGIGVILVAGILIAAAFGIGGAIWAVGYVKKQNNISRLIQEVADKRIPASVLQQAIKEEQSSLLGGVGDYLQWGVIAAGIVLAWPLLKKVTNA